MIYIGKAFIFFARLVVLFWVVVAAALTGFFGACYLFMEFS